MVLKESQLKELLRNIVREVLTELDTVSGTSDMASTGDVPTQELDPVAQDEREREQRKTNRDALQQQQKSFKYQKDKKKAEDRMFKMTKRNAEDKIRDLKRSCV